MFEAKSVGLDGEERLSNAPSFHGTSVVRQEMAGVLERNRLQRSFSDGGATGGPLVWRWATTDSPLLISGDRKTPCRGLREGAGEVHERKIEPIGFREVRSSSQFVLERSSWWENAWCRSRERVRGWNCGAKRSSYYHGSNSEESSNPVGGASLGDVPGVQRAV